MSNVISNELYKIASKLTAGPPLIDKQHESLLSEVEQIFGLKGEILASYSGQVSINVYSPTGILMLSLRFKPNVKTKIYEFDGLNAVTKFKKMNITTKVKNEAFI